MPPPPKIEPTIEPSSPLLLAFFAVLEAIAACWIAALSCECWILTSAAERTGVKYAESELFIAVCAIPPFICASVVILVVALLSELLANEKRPDIRETASACCDCEFASAIAVSLWIPLI